MLPRPVTLCILDGVGWGRRDVETDAVFAADTPTLDRWTNGGAMWTLLKAHGTAVGLPSDKDMGNSEVGHNAMGAGRVFDQGAKLIDAAIASGRLFESEAWKRATQAKTIHFLGLLSDGNVHSHVDHLGALLDHVPSGRRVRVHVLTDGRDVSARSALTWVKPLEEKLRGMSDGAIATGGGRMLVTMDRYEADWPMVERGWHLHVGGEGRRFASATEAIETLYREDPKVDDQWIPPFVVGDYAGMKDGDAVVLFNFRGDRAIEISRAFDDPSFSAFARVPNPKVFYAGMMEYDGDTHVPAHYLVSPPQISGTVGEALSAQHLRVLAISETQKFGHVTYFFNGNRSAKLPGETWKEIPSWQGPFDRHPEMKAQEICAAACEAITSGAFDHVRINFANGDMVGHTGNFDATVLSVEVVDRCLADLEAATKAAGGVLLVTADHGNADEMVELEKGKVIVVDGHAKPKTSHTLNPVPLVLIDPTDAWRLDGRANEVSGQLAQIGASVLTLCGVDVPDTFLPSLVHPAMKVLVDLRSDTVTRPTKAMLDAMMRAEVGDDVFGDDPTVNRLQAVAAERAGKEAAIFVPSGTMANQIAIRLHTSPGDEVVMESGAHPYNYEAGAAATFSGVQIRPVSGLRGILEVEAVAATFRPEDPHFAPVRLLTVEDTSNRGGGSVYPLERLDALTALAHDRGAAAHLDGARVFNAVVASGTALDRRVRGFDTVSFCFSKGLGAPVGSVLCGPKALIDRAVRVRKALGGGMRQAGFLAAAALWALEHHVDRLKDDHVRARVLAAGLRELGLAVDEPETNMIYVTIADAPAKAKALTEAGVVTVAAGPKTIRLVTHLDVDDRGIEAALGAFGRLAI